VAEFMGTPTMNFLPGRLAGKDGQPVFVLEGTNLSVPLGRSLAGAAGSTCTLGVRPEAVSLCPAGQGQLQGRVELIEPLHPDLFVTVGVSGKPIVIRTGSDDRVRPGDSVGLKLAPGSVHIFAASGERLDGKPIPAPSPEAVG
jgi:ABC-type sugar transport system ATPase subunit